MSTSSHPSRSRRIALVASPALALGLLAALPAAPSYAADDLIPAANGAAWLAGQLSDGALVGEFGPDYGLSIDAGLALSAVRAQAPAVASIKDALAASIDDYVTGEAFGDAGSLYAGAAAKAAVFASVAGSDPAAFGGRDLVADVEGAVSTTTGTAGRLRDTSTFGDFANTIGQSFAVRALATASSPTAAPATGFLLDQQCDAGFFRLSFAAPDAADQTCDGDPASTASTDVTALALLNLDASGLSSADVTAAESDAVAWLVSTQGSDGSWGGDAPTTAPNANSTGLAAWALKEAGTPAATAAATRAAVYLRTLQADDFAPCTTGLSPDNGAIAYDPAALADARADGIDTATDQFRRATAQALPALLLAPAGSYSAKPTAAKGYVQAGSEQAVKATTLAPGQTVCFARGTDGTLVNANAKGTAVGTVTVPRGTKNRTYRVALTNGPTGSVELEALDKTTFTIDLKRTRVPAGKKVRLTVRGLAEGESVTLRYEGRAIQRALASKGTYRTSFQVTRQRGIQRVQVIGEFGNRRATQKFRVVSSR